MKYAIIVGNIRKKSALDNRSIVVAEKYYQFTLKGGYYPLIIPYNLDDKHFQYYLTTASCIIFPGGGDISPSKYNEELHPKTHTPIPARDKNELRLLHHAFQGNNIPILAICRGMQLLNVYLGGSLYQDISLHWDTDTLYKHYGDKDQWHEVQLDKQMENTLLQRQYLVNSHHHQVVKDYGRGVIPLAYSSDDNILEAFTTSQRLNVLAVQWHPERMSNTPRELNVWDIFP